jgi:hypothetical protein
VAGNDALAVVNEGEARIQVGVVAQQGFYELVLEGIVVEERVVRLSLVLENMQVPQARGGWRRMLNVGAQDGAGPDSMRMSAMPWRFRDTLVVVACVACVAGLLGVVVQ